MSHPLAHNRARLPPIYDLPYTFAGIGQLIVNRGQNHDRGSLRSIRDGDICPLTRTPFITVIITVKG